MKKLAIVLALTLMAAGCNKAEAPMSPEPLDPQQVQTQDTTQNSEETQEPKVTKNVSVYNNTQYGFQVTVPKGSTVEESTKYIRIQNYEYPQDELGGLKPGEYYLEIFIQEGNGLCDEATLTQNVIVSPKVAAKRGKGTVGGDAGGERFTICTLHEGNTFTVTATENSEQGKIANTILDSFKFTK